MAANFFICSCGRLERYLRASSHQDALQWFSIDMAMTNHAALVAGDKIVRIRGPVRSRHDGTIYKFERETGEVLRTIDLRPKPRRR